MYETKYNTPEWADRLFFEEWQRRQQKSLEESENKSIKQNQNIQYIDTRTFGPDSNQCKIFLVNLHPETTKLDLVNRFSVFGEINWCKIPTNHCNIPRGYGFVSFATPEAAKKALKSTPIIHGNKIVVKAAHGPNPEYYK